ncbi:MAG TPA: class I SAM-dependent methyltransferase [Acidobacteriaceae bacterium]
MVTDQVSGESQHEIRLKDREYEAMPDVFVPAPSGWRSSFVDRIEIPPHLDALGALKGLRVLELASGDGRYTVLMAQLGAEVLALDFSFEALRKAIRNVAEGQAPTTYRPACAPVPGDLTARVGLVQADASCFRVAPRAFDRALSASPLDNRDERMKMFCAIADSLKDNGRYVAGVEHDDLYRRMFGLPVIRRYSRGGILIEHLDVPTMRREMAPYFGQMRMRPIRAHLPFTKGLPEHIRVRAALAVNAIPVLRQLGDILLVTAERPRRLPQEGVMRPQILGARSLLIRYKQWRGKEQTWAKDEPLWAASIQHPPARESSSIVQTEVQLSSSPIPDTSECGH